MNKKNLTLGLATLALSIAHASTAQAAIINGVTATTNMGNFNNQPLVSVNDVANGSGLSSLSLNATHAAAVFGNAWASDDGTTTGNITFNLNGLYSLAGFSVWNFNLPAIFAWGINGVDIQTSTDGTSFSTLAGAPSQFAIATDTPQNAEQFSFTPVDAAYVRFNILSNYGNTTNTGLSEIQFNSADSATAVPEPFTILGTLTAMGGGAALKRRLKGAKSKSV